MPDRNLGEAAISGATAVTGLTALSLETLEAGIGAVIALLTVGILGYRFLITRREWRDGRRRKDDPPVL